jgi:peptidoglycan/LPS O-acetylase OafA/YrhL
MLEPSLPGNKMPNKNSDDLLLIVRGLAAVSVVIWHVTGYQGGIPAFLNTSGRTAVWLFFGISGYVIAYGFLYRRYTFSMPDLKDFYINRLLRIYPIFILLTGLAWITEWTVTGVSLLELGDIPAQIFAIQFNQSYKLNGVFWTLGIEMQFYLLAPVIMFFLISYSVNQSKWAGFVAYTACIVLVIFATKKLGWSWDSRNIVGNLPHFLAGMIACVWSQKLNHHRTRFWLAFGGFVAFICYANFLYHIYPGKYWGIQGIVIVDFAILLLVIAHRSWIGGSGFLVKSLSLLGALSYGLYAWHGYWMKVVPWLHDQLAPLLLISLLNIATYVMPHY